MAAMGGSSAVLAAQEALGETQSALGAMERSLRSSDQERAALREHIEREEAKLYGGAVKNPKELQAFQMEVASLKRRLSELDDVSLDLLLQRDEAAERVREAEEKVAAEESSHAANATQLKTERSALAGQVKALDAERAALSSQLGAADFAAYQRARLKDARAVASINGDVCGGCGMQLPRQTVEQTRTDGALVHCPVCRRILVT
jgi:predicted  nucleic acid-binding Zn-ribbon protein